MPNPATKYKSPRERRLFLPTARRTRDAITRAGSPGPGVNASLSNASADVCLGEPLVSLPRRTNSGRRW